MEDDLLGPTPLRCRYCQRPLDPAYYFCLTCAAPYQSIERILPAEPVPYLSDETLVRRMAPRALPVFWTYAIVLVLSGFLALALFGTDDPVGHHLVGSIAILLTTCVCAVLFWESLKVQLRRIGFDQGAAWWGLAALAPLLLLNYVLHRVLLPPEWVGADYGELLDPLWVGVLLVCILPAITEELAFRGLVQHWLHAALSPVKAIGLASVLFTALHFSILSAPYLFLVGVVLGVVRWKTGSLYPSMLIHFLHNLVALCWI